MSRRLDELAHCCHVAGKRHRKLEDFDDYYEARLGRLTDHGLRVLKPCSIGSQGRRCRWAVRFPHPPFNPYVRFSRIRLTDDVLDMVTQPSDNG